MNFFPVFMNLEDTWVFAAGEDAHTEEKLEKLLPYGAKIRLFAPRGMENYAHHPQIVLERRKLSLQDIGGDPSPALVLLSGGSFEENQAISQECMARKIPVNVADVPSLCSFYFPALITRGPFTVAVSSSGVSPASVVWMRKRIEPLIPDHVEEILPWAAALRNQLKEEVRIRPELQVWIRHILSLAVSEALERDRPLTEEEIYGIIRNLTEEGCL